MTPESYVEMAEVEGVHWWFVARRKIIARAIELSGLSTKRSILEVGCGTGGNLNLLSSYGQVDAIDMDLVAIKLANDNLPDNVRIKHGHCPGDLPFDGKKYDLICLFDVLEHVDEDEETLIMLKERLNDGGEILLTVPAYQWLWGPHDENLHHKRRYTLSLVKALAHKVGLTVETSTYFNTLLFPLVVLGRLLGRIFNIGAGTATPPVFINRFLKKIFSIEKFFIGRVSLPFGVSILVRLKAH